MPVHWKLCQQGPSAFACSPPLLYRHMHRCSSGNPLLWPTSCACVPGGGGGEMLSFTCTILFTRTLHLLSVHLGCLAWCGHPCNCLIALVWSVPTAGWHLQQCKHSPGGLPFPLLLSGSHAGCHVRFCALDCCHLGEREDIPLLPSTAPSGGGESPAHSPSDVWLSGSLRHLLCCVNVLCSFRNVLLVLPQGRETKRRAHSSRCWHHASYF